MMSTPSTATALAGLDQPPPEVAKANSTAIQAVELAGAIVIDSPSMYSAAGEEVAALRSKWKQIDDQRKHLKEPFLEGGRRIDEFFRGPLAKIADAADRLKQGMLVFQQAEEKRVAEERRRIEEEQRRERMELERQQREAAERERQARLESERLQREAQERADAERRKREAEAEAARRAGDEAAAAAAEKEAAEAQARADEEARKAREAAEAEAIAAQQLAEQAQQALELAEVAPAPLVESSAVSGATSVRKTWAVKSVDKRALVIAAGKAAEAGDDTMLAYLEVNEKALNGIAKALKSAARVAGVVFGEVASIASRGGR